MFEPRASKDRNGYFSNDCAVVCLYRGVCFGQKNLGNHGNMPNCYGSLQIPEIIFHKPCLNSLQTYGRPGRFVQRRALTGNELSFIPQGEPAYICRRPGNKQVFLYVLTRRIFKLRSNLCLILTTFPTRASWDPDGL